MGFSDEDDPRIYDSLDRGAVSGNVFFEVYVVDSRNPHTIFIEFLCTTDGRHKHYGNAVYLINVLVLIDHVTIYNARSSAL